MGHDNLLGTVLQKGVADFSPKVSPSMSDESGYDSIISCDDNERIKSEVFNLIRMYEEKDELRTASEDMKEVQASINRKLFMYV